MHLQSNLWFEACRQDAMVSTPDDSILNLSLKAWKSRFPQTEGWYVCKAWELSGFAPNSVRLTMARHCNGVRSGKNGLCSECWGKLRPDAKECHSFLWTTVMRNYCNLMDLKAAGQYNDEPVPDVVWPSKREVYKHLVDQCDYSDSDVTEDDADASQGGSVGLGSSGHSANAVRKGIFADMAEEKDTEAKPDEMEMEAPKPAKRRKRRRTHADTSSKREHRWGRS